MNIVDFRTTKSGASTACWLQWCLWEESSFMQGNFLFPWEQMQSWSQADSMVWCTPGNGLQSPHRLRCCPGWWQPPVRIAPSALPAMTLSPACTALLNFVSSTMKPDWPLLQIHSLRILCIMLWRSSACVLQTLVDTTLQTFRLSKAPILWHVVIHCLEFITVFGPQQGGNRQCQWSKTDTQFKQACNDLSALPNLLKCYRLATVQIGRRQLTATVCTSACLAHTLLND